MFKVMVLAGWGKAVGLVGAPCGVAGRASHVLRRWHLDSAPRHAMAEQQVITDTGAIVWMQTTHFYTFKFRAS
jgi:hypothetical protein